MRKALELCRRDLGRPIKLIQSARLPNDVLVVEYSGTYDLPDLPSVTEYRVSMFEGDRRLTSVILEKHERHG